MNDDARERVREAFNDPASSVRILVATDAASEGLNLHRSARYLLHYDCPWNPSRLEQRNGRLDRYGQARDVTVHHFLSDDDPDLKFLDHVIRKADEIREDLGSVNELFDTAAHKLLVAGEDLARVEFELEHGLTQERKRVRDQGIPGIFGSAGGRDPDNRLASAKPPGALLHQLEREIDFDPAALRRTLETAMAATGGRPQLDRVPNPATGETNGAGEFWRLLHPDLTGWRETIDESLRIASRDGITGPTRRLAFDANSLLRKIGGRHVFSPQLEVALLHLAHPLIERALRTLTLRRLPGPAEAARWTVRRGGVPRGMDALILLSLEELAVNELRETFHHWVRTIALPVRGGALEKPMAHGPARNLADSARRTQGGPEDTQLSSATPAEREQARAIFLHAEADLEAVVAHHAQKLTDSLQVQLQADGGTALQDANERYRSRQGEVSELIEQQSVKRLQREIETLRRSLTQGRLFDQRRGLARIADSIQEKQREIERRRRHYEEAREQLERERRRIVDRLLPKRHALAGEAQAFPVTVEVRLP